MSHTEGRSNRDRTRVLIIAADSMVAALVALLLDPDQFDPEFPQSLERPEDALARVRAPLVLLLDFDVDAVRSDLFFARIAKTRAAVVMFAGPLRATVATSDSTDIERLATERGARWVRLPTNRQALTETINAAIAVARSSGAWSVAAGVIVGAFAFSRVALTA